MLSELSDNLCWISYCHGVIRNILDHYAAGTDYAAVADGYSRADDDSCAQPAILANSDGEACFYWLAAFHIIDGVVRGYQLAVRTYQGAVADGNQGFIEHRGAIVDEYILTHLDTVAMVAVEGWADGGLSWNARNQFFDNGSIVFIKQG